MEEDYEIGRVGWGNTGLITLGAMAMLGCGGHSGGLIRRCRRFSSPAEKSQHDRIKAHRKLQRQARKRNR